MMRYLGYALAVVVGVVGLVGGIGSGAGALAGAAVGWLVASVVLIGRRENARVEGRDDAVFAIFDGLTPMIWGISVAILVVGGVIGWLIKH